MFGKETQLSKQRFIQTTETIIHQQGVRKNRCSFGVSFKVIAELPYLIGQPKVVLIAQKDIVALAGPNRPFKVAGSAYVSLVRQPFYFKWHLIGKSPDNVTGRIRGTIVADNDFIGQKRLPGDTVQLVS